jgi:hypothetical protein
MTARLYYAEPCLAGLLIVLDRPVPNRAGTITVGGKAYQREPYPHSPIDSERKFAYVVGVYERGEFLAGEVSID